MIFRKKSIPESGQAMTEYAIMSLAMCAVSAFLFEELMVAFEAYTKAFYLLLILPIP